MWRSLWLGVCLLILLDIRGDFENASAVDLLTLLFAAIAVIGPTVAWYLGKRRRSKLIDFPDWTVSCNGDSLRITFLAEVLTPHHAWSLQTWVWLKGKKREIPAELSQAWVKKSRYIATCTLDAAILDGQYALPAQVVVDLDGGQLIVKSPKRTLTLPPREIVNG